MHSQDNSKANEQGAMPAFPIDLLPEEVQDLCRAVAESRCVDISVPGALALAAIGAAIGLARIAYDEFADWEEIPVFWVTLVSPSGTRKTVVLDDLFAPHKARQQVRFEEHAAAMREYEAEHAAWKDKTKEPKGSKSERLPEPSPPVLQHLYTCDTTMEGLVKILSQAPRGVAVVVDELAGFFGSLGRYSGKADQDRAFYLSLFRGTQYKKDRSSAETIVIAKASASIVGGIQPSILRMAFDSSALASGLASRFLLVRAPATTKQYRQGPTASAKAAYAELIDGLYQLRMEPVSTSVGGMEFRPQQVHLSDEARSILREFVPQWSLEGNEAEEDVRAAMSKLEGYVLRIALVLRVCREVAGTARPEDPILAKDLKAGIRMATWFREQALWVYDELHAADEQDVRDRLRARAELIRIRYDGAVTAREWRKRNSRLTIEEAKAELDALVSAKLAIWRKRPPGPKGGRPTVECVAIDSEESLEGSEVSGFGFRVAGGKARSGRDWTSLRSSRGGSGTGGCSGLHPETSPYRCAGLQPAGRRA